MGLPEHTRAAVVIVAAGRGQRAGGHVAKQWQPLAGARVIDHTLHVFRTHPLIGRIVIVLHPEDLDQRFDGADTVAGGATRALSVRAGLEALADAPPQHVLIHDVARPCLSGALISRVIAALGEAAGSAPALPVSDALWTGAAGRVTGTQNRQGLYRAQTPQGFHFAPILAAHRIATPDAADDVAVARAAGLDVAIVEGSEDNLKITYPPDFERATRILETLDGYQARKRI